MTPGERRTRVVELYQQGGTLRDIGREVGVSHEQVRLDLMAVNHAFRYRQVAGPPDPNPRTEVARRHARLDEAPHGTRSGYVHWGCRCDACRIAHVTYQRERREEARAS